MSTPANPLPQLRHAITTRSAGTLAGTIVTNIAIREVGNPILKSFVGIWDTGATATVITQDVVDSLGLKPIGMTKVNTASELGHVTPQFIVDIFLKTDLQISNVVVTLGKLTPNFHALIGMDIITLGDFSICNFNGSTCMSFRIPSLHEIDYVKNPHMGSSPFTNVNPSRNNPCPCGSGKLYKRCHGKDL